MTDGEETPTPNPEPRPETTAPVETPERNAESPKDVLQEAIAMIESYVERMRPGPEKNVLEQMLGGLKATIWSYEHPEPV